MPTLEEIQDAALMQGVPEEVAQHFWEHYEAQGWVRGNGQPVKNWRVLLTTWQRDVHGFSAQAAATKAKFRPVVAAPRLCPVCKRPATSWVSGKCGQCYREELRQ